MAEEYKSIKIKEDVKNRLDRYKRDAVIQTAWMRCLGISS